MPVAVFDMVPIPACPAWSVSALPDHFRGAVMLMLFAADKVSEWVDGVTDVDDQSIAELTVIVPASVPAPAVVMTTSALASAAKSVAVLMTEVPVAA
jgi:hypothetical protein